MTSPEQTNDRSKLMPALDSETLLDPREAAMWNLYTSNVPEPSFDRMAVALQAIEHIEGLGREILPFAGSPDLEIEVKPDGTRVTEKDKYVAERLHDLLPLCKGSPVVTEETLVPANTRQAWSEYWLSDPIDGTNSFIDGRDDFTILVAHVENDQPAIGIIHSPVEQRTVFAIAGEGVFIKDAQDEVSKLDPADIPESGKVHVGTYDLQNERRHFVQSFAAANQLARTSMVPSASPSGYGALELIDGKADLMIAAGTTHEWDIAAAVCIFKELGWEFTDGAGDDINFNASHSFTMDVPGAYGGRPGFTKLPIPHDILKRR